MKSESVPGAGTIAPSGIERIHRRREGVVVVPNMSGTPRIIRLHAAYEVENITWKMSKYGAPPQVPSFEDVDDNRTFIGGERSMTNPCLAENAIGHHWFTAGNYSYVLAETEGLTSQMLGARLPADPTVIVSQTDNNQSLPSVNLPAAQFVTGLLGKPFTQ